MHSRASSAACPTRATRRTRARGLRAALLGATLCIAASPPALGAQESGHLPALPPELEAVRTALDRYRDPLVAVRDGYFSTLACVQFERDAVEGEVPAPAGGMGIHFLNMGLLGPAVDPMRPQILIYEPDGEALRLAAAEWFVPLATGVTERPTLFGAPFNGPMEGHEPVMPADLHHYDLHVWLWKENPAGTFSPTNPALRCEGGFTMTEHSAKIVPHH